MVENFHLAMPRKCEQAKNDLSEFVINLRKHFKKKSR